MYQYDVVLSYLHSVGCTGVWTGDVNNEGRYRQVQSRE